MAGELTFTFETQTVDLDEGHFDVMTTCKVFDGSEMVAMGSCHDSTRENVFASQIQNQLDASLSPALSLVRSLAVIFLKEFHVFQPHFFPCQSGS